MPQHRDLDVLRVRRRTQTDQVKNAADDHERQRANHHDRQPAKPHIHCSQP
jgi:hypothetical protein